MDWICPRCTFLNHALYSNQICHVCHNPRPTPSPTPHPPTTRSSSMNTTDAIIIQPVVCDRYWDCSNCTASNLCDKISCTACLSPREHKCINSELSANSLIVTQHPELIVCFCPCCHTEYGTNKWKCDFCRNSSCQDILLRWKCSCQCVNDARNYICSSCNRRAVPHQCSGCQNISTRVKPTYDFKNYNAPTLYTYECKTHGCMIRDQVTLYNQRSPDPDQPSMPIFVMLSSLYSSQDSAVDEKKTIPSALRGLDVLSKYLVESNPDMKDDNCPICMCPLSGEPSVQEPTVHEPAFQEPSVREPSVHEPSAQEAKNLKPANLYNKMLFGHLDETTQSKKHIHLVHLSCAMEHAKNSDGQGLKCSICRFVM